MMARITFSEYELDALRRMAAEGLTHAEICRKMGYDAKIVRREAKRNGIKLKVTRNPFTPAEDHRLLTASYPIPLADLRRLFPKRSVSSLRGRACILGVSFRYSTPSARVWTDTEKDIVRAHYGKARIKDWMHLLPGRPERSIRSIAARIGLSSPFAAAMAPKAVLSPDERAAVIAGRKAGKSITELERAVGYSGGVIRRVLVEEGMMPREATKRYFTQEEDDRLRALTWPQHRADLLRLFPGRTVEVLRARARKFGIKVFLTGNLPKDPPSPVEDAIIRRHYGVFPLRVWRHLLPHRPVSWIIYQANHRIGIRSGLGHFVRRGRRRADGLESIPNPTNSEANHGSADHA